MSSDMMMMMFGRDLVWAADTFALTGKESNAVEQMRR